MICFSAMEMIMHNSIEKRRRINGFRYPITEEHKSIFQCGKETNESD